MGKQFNVVRVDTFTSDSVEAEQYEKNVDLSRQLLGDQYNFGWALSSAFRVLANPSAPVPLPRKPDKDKDFEGAIAYWHALQWLLVYRLGWARPGKGMSELYYYLCMPNHENDSLKVIGEMDDTLQLISEVWLKDGYLENYISWAQNVQESYISRGRDSLQSIEYFNQDEQTEAFARRTPAGLHLEPQGWHYFLKGQHEPRAEFQVQKQDGSSATLLIDSAWGWYEALCDAGETMKDLEISVFVKSMGFMGKYRYSEMTRLWFTGSHDVHLMGN
jgi:hypothetical protein